ncbi:MAG: ATP-dependent DNA helicase RecQ [Saprospiraceae bacterium]
MPTPVEILKANWGFDTFRPLQEEIIQSVLDGKDALALLPTGGGKSICFQVPALAKEGICIVVSPLIALMKDQVDNLKKRNIKAIAIYSGMRYTDIDRALDNCIYGNIKFLYLSPERLVTDLARARIAQMNVNLFAIDEAHCISQWGYDFRPPYLEIANIRELHPKVPVLALTATATHRVVGDIQEKLNFSTPNLFQKSFERSNLSYVVLPEKNKYTKLLEIVRNVKGTGIIYTRSRRNTKEVASFLQRNKVSADYYHAGLNPEIRTHKQEAWMKNQIRIMVSTNAFGMGIDKPDVRSVIHLELPDSLEAYFQEAGRAGRDEKKAYCVLLYDELDGERLRRNFETAFPSMKVIRQVYRALGSYFQLAVGAGIGRSFDFDIGTFLQRYNLKAIPTYNCLKILSQAGWLVLSEAIFSPATIKIKVNREVLYDYQLKQPKMDKVIKWILRLYPQSINNYAPFQESKIANKVGASRGDLAKAFQKMVQDQIIDYQPQKDKPQLIYLKERVDADNLAIDMALYNFRKKRYLENIEQAIKYAENPRCRSRQLLKYFGEKNAPLCGSCDVCLGRTKADFDEQEYERYKQKIKRLVKREKLTTAEIATSFGKKRTEFIEQVLAYLMDEGFVEIKEEIVVWQE